MEKFAGQKDSLWIGLDLKIIILIKITDLINVMIQCNLEDYILTVQQGDFSGK